MSSIQTVSHASLAVAGRPRGATTFTLLRRPGDPVRPSLGCPQVRELVTAGLPWAGCKMDAVGQSAAAGRKMGGECGSSLALAIASTQAAQRPGGLEEAARRDQRQAVCATAAAEAGRAGKARALLLLLLSSSSDGRRGVCGRK